MPATVWNGYVSFGLVTFPVKLYSAARPDPVHFHMLHRKDLSRVKEVWYCSEENRPIDKADIVKGYETGKGEYVVVTADELKRIAPPTAKTMDILQFVAAADVDPVLFVMSGSNEPNHFQPNLVSLLVSAIAPSVPACTSRLFPT